MKLRCQVLWRDESRQESQERMGKALGLTQKAYVGLEIGWGRLYVGLEMEDEGSRERGLIPEVLGLGL